MIQLAVRCLALAALHALVWLAPATPAAADPPAGPGVSSRPGTPTQGTYLGKLGGNPLSADSTANPVGRYGSPTSPTSIHNPVGRWGSPVSPQGVRNPVTKGGPKLYADDGTYLGRLNANPLDPESVSNPVGRYGSPTSPTSINNPTGRYGSRTSPQSPNNPVTTRSPVLYGK
ncbi:MAG: hypothetical protein ACQGVK_24870 [Myxococcota bacterium]